MRAIIINKGTEHFKVWVTLDKGLQDDIFLYQVN